MVFRQGVKHNWQTKKSRAPKPPAPATKVSVVFQKLNCLIELLFIATLSFCLVALSSSNISGFSTTAMFIGTLWFCMIDNWTPFHPLPLHCISPTTVTTYFNWVCVWSKNGVYAGDVCWINTIKESKLND